MRRFAAIANKAAATACRARPLSTFPEIDANFPSVYAQTAKAVKLSYFNATVAVVGAATCGAVLYVQSEQCCPSRKRAAWLKGGTVLFEKRFENDKVPLVHKQQKPPAVRISAVAAGDKSEARIVVEEVDAEGKVTAAYCSNKVLTRRLDTWRSAVEAGYVAIDKPVNNNNDGSSGSSITLSRTKDSQGSLLSMNKTATFLTLYKISSPKQASDATKLDLFMCLAASFLSAKVVESASDSLWKGQFQGRSIVAALRQIMLTPGKAGLAHGAKVFLVAALPVTAITGACIFWRHWLPLWWPGVDLDPEYTQDVLEAPGYSSSAFATKCVKLAPLVIVPVLGSVYMAAGTYAFSIRALPLLRRAVRWEPPAKPLP